MGGSSSMTTEAVLQAMLTRLKAVVRGKGG
jgi:hypothetical protein